MASDTLSIVFFGSGPVAAKSLTLLTPNFKIEAVVTKPATSDEMGSILDNGRLYAVSNKQELDELFTKKPFNSRLAVLIDFGIIVSQGVIDYFPLGIINSHFSLLPEWRGADPISFAILSGQKQTGISLMLLSEGMDEGPLLAQAAHAIPGGATTISLTDSLIELSNSSLKEVVPAYVRGEISPAPQSEASIATVTAPSYSRKLTKEDGLIDWAKPATRLEREIRAFIAWPKSRATLGGRDVIITAAQVVAKNDQPGEIMSDNKQLIVFCGQDALAIDRLKPAGKPEMSVAAFLAGYRL